MVGQESWTTARKMTAPATSTTKKSIATYVTERVLLAVRHPKQGQNAPTVGGQGSWMTVRKMTALATFTTKRSIATCATERDIHNNVSSRANTRINADIPPESGSETIWKTVDRIYENEKDEIMTADDFFK